MGARHHYKTDLIASRISCEDRFPVGYSEGKMCLSAAASVFNFADRGQSGGAYDKGVGPQDLLVSALTNARQPRAIEVKRAFVAAEPRAISFQQRSIEIHGLL